MTNNIAILSIASSLALFLWHFIKDKEWKETSLRAVLPALKLFVILSMPYLALFGLAKLGDLGVAAGAGYFALGVAMPCLLGRLVKSPLTRSLLLLALCIGGYYSFSDHPMTQIESLLAGIMVWKCATNLLAGAATQFEDLMPSFVWLSGLQWATADASSMSTEHQIGLILGTISAAILLRWLQTPLLKEDKFYLKRIALATVGGLAVLLVTSKMILVGHLDSMAIVAGVGFLAAYIFQSIDSRKQESQTTSKALMQLLLIGILTVAATRIFGTVGTLVLSASMLVASNSRTARMASLFWGGRAIIQGYVLLYDPNVTGINLNHPYTSAALFAGFLMIVMLTLWIRDIAEKKWLSLGFLLLTTVAPLSAGFFLHPEPTASMLVAVSTASIIVSLFAACLLKTDLPPIDNLMLAPAMMALIAHLSSELLGKGDEATAQEKLVVIVALACVIVCIALVQKVFRFRPINQVHATETSST